MEAVRKSVALQSFRGRIQMTQTHRNSMSLVLVAALLSAATGVARAATIETFGVSGNWTSGTTWTGGNPPGAGDTVYLNDSGVTVTVDSPTAAVDFVRVHIGNTLDLASGGTLNTTNLRVGWDYGAGTIARNGGVLNVTGNVELGDASDLTIDDGDTIGGNLDVMGPGEVTLTAGSSSSIGGVFQIQGSATFTTGAGSSSSISTLLMGFYGAGNIVRGADSTLSIDTLRIRDNSIYVAAPGDVINTTLQFETSAGGIVRSAVSTANGTGLTLDGSTLTFHDNDDVIELTFADPTTFGGGDYWALRWLGSHTTTLNGYLGDEITIDITGFDTALYGTPTVFEDGGYTYVGVQGLVIPEPMSLTLLALGGLLFSGRRGRRA